MNISNFVSNNNRKSNIVVATKTGSFRNEVNEEVYFTNVSTKKKNWNNNDVIKNTLNAIYMRKK